MDENTESLNDIILANMINQFTGHNTLIDDPKFNFKAYDETYYENKFPGFPKYFYKILSDSSKEKNKIIDLRETTINVDDTKTQINM